MTKKKRDALGMSASITRRDFMNGVGIGIGSTMLPSSLLAGPGSAQDQAGYYPPELTGMRGSHPGSFEVAHALRDGAEFTGEDTGETFDLVVVGGGISGLAAAYFYREQAGRDASVLVLENHDDFGGHAKRNEFTIDDRVMIGFGGTMFISAPGGYPPVAKRLMQELGIDVQRFYDAFDRELYASHGMGRAAFFGKPTFAADHLAVGDLTDPDVLASVPMSEKGKADLVRLLEDELHYLDGMSREEQIDYLLNTSYETYLREKGGFGDEAIKAISARPRGVWAVGIDAFPARTAWSSGYPGFGDLELGIYNYAEESDEPNIFHFPDGNATVARLLVRKLIPGSAPGDDMEDIVTARFDYGSLDDRGSPVRIRLNSTVVRVRHEDDHLDRPVRVSYVQDGKAWQVRAKRVVMACYHAIIPRLCPEMPAPQRKLLSASLRAPLVYTNVLIRNWTSFEALGFHHADCPGSYFHRVMLDYPVSLGEYRFSKGPDEPIVVFLGRIPGEPGPSAREQFLSGQRELLATPFDTFEWNVRDQLGRVLGDGGFDPARDIAAITVNRWPHGYAYGYDPETDRVAFEPSQWPKEKRSWVEGSKRFGNISIAATDAASNAMTEAAIEEAYRAVNELT